MVSLSERGRRTNKHMVRGAVQILVCMHCKNKLVVLTTEWFTLVADELKRQWLCSV